MIPGTDANLQPAWVKKEKNQSYPVKVQTSTQLTRCDRTFVHKQMPTKLSELKPHCVGATDKVLQTLLEVMAVTGAPRAWLHDCSYHFVLDVMYL